MHAWIQRALCFIDRFVPESLSAVGGDTQRNARTMVLLSFMLMCWGPPYFVTTMLLGTPTVSFLVITATFMMATVPFLLRATANLRAVIYIALFALWWVLFGSAFALGGVASPSLIWLPCLPLIAMMMLSKREAIRWTVFTALCFAALPLANAAGFEFARELQGGAFDLYWGIVAATSVLMFGSVGVGYETTKDQMKADLEEAMQATDQALAGTRLVLDNVDQGLLILDAEGRMGSQASKSVEDLVGTPATGASFSELLQQVDPDTGDWWALAWESVSEGFLPMELSLAQLPSRLEHGERSLEIRYQPVMREEEMTQVVVVINDVSAELARERAQLLQRETLAVFQHLMRDPSGFEGFLREARALIARMPQMGAAQTLRAVHTLKGNAGLFSVQSVAEVCHEVEDQMIQGASETADVERISQAWSAFEARLLELRGECASSSVSVSKRDLATLDSAIRCRLPHAELLTLVDGWDKEPLAGRLCRFGERGKALASKLGKEGLRVEVFGGELRANAQLLEPIWSAFAHAVRNAVDHGVELPEVRLAAKKEPHGTLRFGARLEQGALLIELSDDGAGVDWERVRGKAQEMGLPSETQGDLELALFHDGLSCKQEVSELSGRGVGLSALREAAEALNGSVEIESARGQGSTLRLRLPGALVWRPQSPDAKAA